MASQIGHIRTNNMAKKQISMEMNNKKYPLYMASDVFIDTLSSRHCLFVCKRQREMFYLTTHSTHFIYGYMASNMVKDHSDSEEGNPLLPHGLLFPINSKDNTYHGLWFTSRGALAGTRNSSMGPHLFVRVSINSICLCSKA